MKLHALLAVSMLALGAPAYADTYFSDNFDAEAGGATVTNYAGFANFDVVGGTVDLLRQPNGFGLNCAGGVGSSCVDLDGSTGNGGSLVTKQIFTFGVGDLVSLSFDISGSHRGTMEDFDFGFQSQGGAVNYNNVTVTSDHYGVFSFGDLVVNDLEGYAFGLPAVAPFGAFTLSFTAGSAGSAKAYIGSPSADNIGAIVDNVSVSVAAVPEPATWAMMIGGFALVGSAMRRRGSAVSFA